MQRRCSRPMTPRLISGDMCSLTALSAAGGCAEQPTIHDRRGESDRLWIGCRCFQVSARAMKEMVALKTFLQKSRNFSCGTEMKRQTPPSFLPAALPLGCIGFIGSSTGKVAAMCDRLSYPSSVVGARLWLDRYFPCSGISHFLLSHAHHQSARQ